MQNLTSHDSRDSRVSESRNSIFNSSRLNSSSNLAEASLARGINGLELPPLTSSSEVDIDDEFSEAASGMPTVTSPLGTVEQLNDVRDFGSDGSEKSGLTSPNLVSTLSGSGLTLSNATPLSKMAMMPAMMGGQMTGALPFLSVH